MRNKNFAAFILTHGRPDKQYTYNNLIRGGYTGDIFFLVDDEDKTLQQYQSLYGDRVLVFSKDQIAKTFDSADNFPEKRAIIYARNASFEIAKKLGLKNFIQLDDDYVSFDHRSDREGRFLESDSRVFQLDEIFDALVDFLESTKCASIALSQNGDFIGGKHSTKAKSIKLLRKCMNSFVCSTERPFKFVGKINEDVNTYTYRGSLGDLFFTTTQVSLKQKQTQKNSGGMTEFYLDSGTYIKSFYSVLFMPSSVKIKMMQTDNQRLHHSVSWRNTVPMILSEDFKK